MSGKIIREYGGIIIKKTDSVREGEREEKGGWEQVAGTPRVERRAGRRG